MKFLKLILSALILMNASMTVQASDEWKTILAIQLNKDKGCQVVRLSGTQVFELLGKTNIRTEAHCVDGRVYTAARSGTLENFHLSICPTKC